MKTALISIAAGLLLTTAALATDSANQPGVRTVTGCVSRIHKGSYVITGGRQQFRVTGGQEADLPKLLQHTVRVTGSVGESNPAAQAVAPPHPGSTTGVTYNTIEIESLEDVSRNCSLHGGESR